ncbi:hypothetical protein VTO42DRAFT_7908 [Malbranchea cinnamomea]
MSSGPFRIIEHIIPGQHIREFPRATATEQEEIFRLAVKQYVPIDNPNPQPGDLTIIGAHANGFPKELYEPLWEEIHARSKRHGFRIRSIWIADVAHQGQSGVLNENALGNDPSWMDHPRDLMHLINLKRAEMPRPLIGIGHSMGGNNLVNVALMHPRLFTSLILLDPVIYPPDESMNGKVPITTLSSTHRRDLWPSRQAAAESLKKNKFYQKWDPRVLNRWIKYGLRDVPTALFPDIEAARKAAGSGPSETPVTLTTTRHQEVFTFNRPNYEGAPDKVPVNRKTHPDLDRSTGGWPYYRAEVPRTFMNLPYVRPSVLYLFAELSDMSAEPARNDKLKYTGVGVGGSGGAAEGRVKGHLLKDVGHLIAMEAVDESADVVSEWIGSELQRWRTEEAEFRVEWSKKSKVDKMTIDANWVKHVPVPARRAAKHSGSKSKL